MVEVYSEDEYKLVQREVEEPHYIRCPMCGRVLLDLRHEGKGTQIVSRCRSCKKLRRIIVR